MLNGYRMFFRPDHPTAMRGGNWDGFVYEHRMVYHDKNGSIPEGHLIHHLNGDRSDNRTANLISVSPGDHTKLHAWISTGAPGMETLRENGENCWEPSIEPARYCASCGLTIQNSKAIKYCSEECCRETRLLQSKRPTMELLLSEIRSARSIRKVAATYGVSDNSVRKWLIGYGLDPKAISSRAWGKPQEGSETSGAVTNVESA